MLKLQNRRADNVLSFSCTVAGGYKDSSGKSLVTALRICSIFGLCACCFAVPAAFFRNPYLCIGAIWFVLFFGGCIVPPATGICISSVPVEMRSFAGAMSMLIYNVFGYAAGMIVALIFFLSFGVIGNAHGGNAFMIILHFTFDTAPLICGYIAQASGLTWGYRVVLFTAAFALSKPFFFFHSLYGYRLDLCWNYVFHQ